MINILTNQEKEKYVFNVIFSVCNTEYSFNSKADLTISYGKNIPLIKGKHIHIYQSDFWDNYKKKESMPQRPLKRFYYNDLFKDLIGLFYKKNTKNIIEQKGELIVLNLDIIASIFFMITRYEEYIQLEMKDEHQRFPAEESIAYKEGFLMRPIVNEYIELLFYLIKKLNPDIGISKRKFEVFMTHDVDHLLMYDNFPIKRLTCDLIRKKSFNLFIKSLICFLKGKWHYRKDYKKDPYWLFHYFLKEEKGVKNVFYFMSGGTFKWEKEYNIKDKKVLELIKELQDSKVEIGLHGSYYSFNNKSRLKKEKKILDNILGIKKYGIRQHYLKFDIKKTLQIQNELDFKYDTTCGYSKHEGFRFGICCPFRVYDLERDKALDLIEIPLIVMDVTLKDHRKLTIDEAIKVIQNLKNVCQKHNGVFTTLWHNSFFYENEEWKKVYKECII